MEEYLVKVTIQNNIFNNFMLKNGCSTIKDFSNKFDVSYIYCRELLNFKAKVFKEDLDEGLFYPKFLDFCKKLNCEPFDIIPKDYKYKTVNSYKRKCSENDLLHFQDYAEFKYNGLIEGTKLLPFDSVDEKEIRDKIYNLLDTLKPKERHIVYEYYINGRSFVDISKDYNQTDSNICAIFKKAMKKLRRKFITSSYDDFRADTI